MTVKQLMRERLLSYAVNCLLAAGYDSAADVICSMNTSEEPKNSFVVIEGLRGGPFFVYIQRAVIPFPHVLHCVVVAVRPILISLFALKHFNL